MFDVGVSVIVMANMVYVRVVFVSMRCMFDVGVSVIVMANMVYVRIALVCMRCVVNVRVAVIVVTNMIDIGIVFVVVRCVIDVAKRIKAFFSMIHIAKSRVLNGSFVRKVGREIEGVKILFLVFFGTRKSNSRVRCGRREKSRSHKRAAVLTKSFKLLVW